MITQITRGVKISVDTMYQSEFSHPENDHFMFAYKISIENMTDATIQLVSRRWNIFDSNGSYHQVEGEGVVGLQPVIEPGSYHQYVSGCHLKTEMGAMKGCFFMTSLPDGEEFEVEIPTFHLIAPYRLN
ncbi:MAG: Co2+/Mg2+ efflux protein ApaG [Arcticibacter sp.]